MEELLEILGSMHPDVDFEICDTLMDDNILDSYELVSEIRDTFDVKIPMEEIIPENFNSAEAIYDLIESLENEA